MTTFRDVWRVQWRGWTLMTVSLLPVVVGTAVFGPRQFFAQNLGVPNEWGIVWFALNGFLCWIGAALVLKNLWLFRVRWTHQEVWLYRGLFWASFGGGVGYWTRAFYNIGVITVGTPYLTLSSLCLIYALARDPTRFTRGSVEEG